MINTGVMLFRNSFWTRRFVSQWLKKAEDPLNFNEQIGFDNLVASLMRSQSQGGNLPEKIVILPIHVLNSEAPAMWKQQPTHQVIITIFFSRSISFLAKYYYLYMNVRFFTWPQKIIYFERMFSGKVLKISVPRLTHFCLHRRCPVSWDYQERFSRLSRLKRKISSF
jgi:hypothetical protein